MAGTFLSSERGKSSFPLALQLGKGRTIVSEGLIRWYHQWVMSSFAYYLHAASWLYTNLGVVTLSITQFMVSSEVMSIFISCVMATPHQLGIASSNYGVRWSQALDMKADNLLC
eukprot:2574941-Amphidinium_carterae.2